MKRSEALEKLEQLLETIPVSDNGYYYQDAETILDFIEKELKMVPPVRNADQKSSYGYARVWTWEKETK